MVPHNDGSSESKPTSSDLRQPPIPIILPKDKQSFKRATTTTLNRRPGVRKRLSITFRHTNHFNKHHCDGDEESEEGKETVGPMRILSPRATEYVPPPPIRKIKTFPLSFWRPQEAKSEKSEKRQEDGKDAGRAAVTQMEGLGQEPSMQRPRSEGSSRSDSIWDVPMSEPRRTSYSVDEEDDEDDDEDDDDEESSSVENEGIFQTPVESRRGS
ncbi:hypothetical protein EJ02DRAFT_483 [Clathrospora elynae]|uniref:Uncharacterized protein n=1 Tax=Clathrospora elynae TaxID=706981 RepID=A0A6A5T677_9PLEO|nr:hypothetical protein EJ02DRAFT_483 [Clathrospora elynae]